MRLNSILFCGLQAMAQNKIFYINPMKKNNIASGFLDIAKSISNKSKIGVAGIFAGVFCVVFAVAYTIICNANRQD
jgi:hypothetical protein